jgi:hypothetical protein
MRLPLIVDCTGDLYVADSVQSAESAMEPVDVRNGEYDVYDADGRLLEATVAAGRREKTVVRERDPVDLRTDELRGKIIAYLRAYSRMNGAEIVESVLAQQPLSELIARLRNVAPI